jgi:general stress protein YciG
MTKKAYVFDHFLFVSRRGVAPKQWIWEIRSKSRPEARYFSGAGFHSAQAALAAGKPVLVEVREAARKDNEAKQVSLVRERELKIAKRTALAAARVARNTPERRSEIARLAAHARAKALTPERRSEIAHQGEAAAKAARNTPEQRRSDIARLVAQARAKALTPESPSEMARKGGTGSKGSPKKKRPPPPRPIRNKRGG